MAIELVWSVEDKDAELPFRVRPLREQWEARGPGLLHAIRRQIHGLEFPTRVTIRLERPAGGFGGGCIESSDVIRLQAVLVNPMPELPEVARLGWLIAQLGFHLRTVPSSHSPQVAMTSNVRQSPLDPAQLVSRVRIALIPHIIFAAQEVELAAMDDATVELALQHWLPNAEAHGLTGAELLAWWKAAPVHSAVHDSGPRSSSTGVVAWLDRLHGPWFVV